MQTVDLCFLFQAEDGIRGLVRSRGLGEVYKRQRETRLSNSKNVALPADALISTVVDKFEHMRKTTDISNAAFAVLSGILEKMSDAGVFESTPDVKNLLSTVAENDLSLIHI